MSFPAWVDTVRVVVADGWNENKMAELLQYAYEDYTTNLLRLVLAQGVDSE